MYSRFAFALISFSVIAFGGALPAISNQCPENEVFMPCGSACAPSCKNPNPGPMCTRQCIVGCFCKEGYLRNSEGVCVQTRDCEKAVEEQPMAFAYPPPIQQCKANEFFMTCGSACVPTCKNPIPSPMCTKQCVPGCFCKPGFLKNEHGMCVETEKCNVEEPKSILSAPVLMCNGDNEEYKQCKGCDGTCDNQHPICPRICVAGCACKKDHVRDVNGRCMPVKQCPVQQAPESIVAPVLFCNGDNEEYKQCKGCDGTCDNQHPLCPRICVAGCACKKDHVRDINGRCMHVTQCPVKQQEQAPENIVAPVVCFGEHEEYKQCRRCDGTCDNPHPLCPRSPRVCRPGCACKEGHVRDASGVCVPLEKCPAPKVAAAFVIPEEPKCPQNEIFRACGSACPATCANPHPSPVCTRQCVIGCFCQEGFLRNAVGVCVPAANCEA